MLDGYHLDSSYKETMQERHSILLVYGSCNHVE